MQRIRYRETFASSLWWWYAMVNDGWVEWQDMLEKKLGVKSAFPSYVHCLMGEMKSVRYLCGDNKHKILRELSFSSFYFGTSSLFAGDYTLKMWEMNCCWRLLKCKIVKQKCRPNETREKMVARVCIRSAETAMGNSFQPFRVRCMEWNGNAIAFIGPLGKRALVNINAKSVVERHMKNRKWPWMTTPNSTKTESNGCVCLVKCVEFHTLKFSIFLLWICSAQCCWVSPFVVQICAGPTFN